MSTFSQTPHVALSPLRRYALMSLLAFSLPAPHAQDRGSDEISSAHAETLDVLRQAERMAQDILTTSATPRAKPDRPPHAMALAQQGSRARLYILVSFAMPAPSLHRLAAQAAALRIPLVLRGMSGDSLAITARHAAEIVHAVPGASFEIDPAPFSRFAITRVPSFVIAAPSAACTNACTPDQAGDVLTGDVSLDYALERLSRGTDASASMANELLARLRIKP